MHRDTLYAICWWLGLVIVGLVAVNLIVFSIPRPETSPMILGALGVGFLVGEAETKIDGMLDWWGP